jgi:hypothetical protein
MAFVFLLSKIEGIDDRKIKSSYDLSYEDKQHNRHFVILLKGQKLTYLDCPYLFDPINFKN